MVAGMEGVAVAEHAGMVPKGCAAVGAARRVEAANTIGELPDREP
jgi:hypothetical protein